MPGSGEHRIDRPLTINNERSQIQLEASNLAERRFFVLIFAATQ